MQDKDNAVWGTVTLAMPQLVEWQVEGDGMNEHGDRLSSFAKAMTEASEGKEATLRLNILVRF